MRHQLVRPDRAQLAGDDGYRFRHLLIRDAAYDALPKAVRADLHARFADWLDEQRSALVERDEIVGYHLEQAGRYRAELGQPDPGLADRAAARLAAAGSRASTARTTGPEPCCSIAQPSSYDRPDRRRRARARVRVGQLDVRCGVQKAEAVPNVPRPPVTIPGRCSRVRLALYLRNVAGEPDTPTSWTRSAVLRFPSRKSGVIHAGLRCSGSCSPPAANFQHAERRRRRTLLQALRYQRLAGYSPVRYGAGVGADPRPAAGRRRDAHDGRARRLAASGFPRPPRAALLAMLGRFDEAWPLAEARSSHLREVTGNTSRTPTGTSR